MYNNSNKYNMCALDIIYIAASPNITAGTLRLFDRACNLLKPT